MRNLFVLFIISLIAFSCLDDKGKSRMVKIMDENVVNNLKTLENTKIYFGHQSVGYNLVSGISDLMKAADNNEIKILETDGSDSLRGGFFAHSTVGENTKPNTKCDAFKNNVIENFKGDLDIASLKFCYVDMPFDGKPEEVFNYYKLIIDSIKSKYPNLLIIHMTIPLRIVQSGWKAKIKKLFGKKIGGYDENIKRYEYNQLLINYYKNDPIFDIAEAESTYPDGSRETFEVHDKTYYAMVPDFTYDRGHLNEFGRKIVAKKMIRIFANTIEMNK